MKCVLPCGPYEAAVIFTIPRWVTRLTYCRTHDQVMAVFGLFHSLCWSEREREREKVPTDPVINTRRGQYLGGPEARKTHHGTEKDATGSSRGAICRPVVPFAAPWCYLPLQIWGAPKRTRVFRSSALFFPQWFPCAGVCRKLLAPTNVLMKRRVSDKRAKSQAIYKEGTKDTVICMVQRLGTMKTMHTLIDQCTNPQGAKKTRNRSL